MATRKDDKDTADRPAEAASSNGEGERGRRASGDGDAPRAARMAERGAEQMRSLAGASARAYRELTDFPRGDVDMLMQSSARLAKGVQDMSWEMMQFTQNSLRIGLKAANEMMTCRTVEDLVLWQRAYLKESVDTFLEESARLLEMSSNVTSDAVGPLSERMQQQGEAMTRH